MMGNEVATSHFQHTANCIFTQAPVGQFDKLTNNFLSKPTIANPVSRMSLRELVKSEEPRLEEAESLVLSSLWTCLH